MISILFITSDGSFFSRFYYFTIFLSFLYGMIRATFMLNQKFSQNRHNPLYLYLLTFLGFKLVSKGKIKIEVIKMKVSITKDAQQQLITQLGEEPTVRINEIRTTG
ncbi:hypothetical protein CVD27_23315 [Neobacillus cucumis]|uniref:Uncharacterized protein n=1 Tax=Neobacillus cucumis TaxID=1740721 RepID=A0A2N5H8P1_9BACI|nr:hypothetical protein CVD27_23315 [Neobacillus cucumis]